MFLKVLITKLLNKFKKLRGLGDHIGKKEQKKKKKKQDLV
jgi:hypothetical protein